MAIGHYSILENALEIRLLVRDIERIQHFIGLFMSIIGSLTLFGVFWGVLTTC